MKKLVLSRPHTGAVTIDDACPVGVPCPHCKTGRPSPPIEAGDPRDLSMALADVDESLRLALPPAYHRPEWMSEHGAWRCAACWTLAWPCPVANAHPLYLSRSFRFELAAAKLQRAVIVPAQEIV